MSRLGALIDDHIRELTGVEFKIAVYLYRRLERKAASAILEIKIADIARATGASTKRTQTVLKHLHEKAVLLVDNRRGRTTRCSLPALPTHAAAVDTSAATASKPDPLPASQSRSAQPAAGKRSTASVFPIAGAKPNDARTLELLVKAYDSADAALLKELDVVAGARTKLAQCLQFMAEKGMAYDTAGLLRADVAHHCHNPGSEFAVWAKHH